jgi:shikimate dehydrogenase
MHSSQNRPHAPATFQVGLIGAGIQHSASPRLHMDEARALGLDYRYDILDLDWIAGGTSALSSLLDDAQAKGFAGLNITYPCKQSVIPLLDTLSDDARSLQSVNTVVFRDGRRIGHNTDWSGFAESFRRGMANARRDHVVLVGAGGAGSAVGYALLQLGTKSLQVFDVDAARAKAMADRHARLFADAQVSAIEDVAHALRDADGLVHASPTGMAKLPGIPVPPESLHAPLWVAEVVYVPLETELLRVARRQGCRTLDGGGMAVFQAALAFELFCGMKPDAERMLRRFNDSLRGAAV